MLSQVTELKEVKFPKFTGTRLMMMPFRLEHDFPLELYRGLVASMVDTLDDALTGVAYVTIDEAVVPAGETQRRPGLHVDGMGGWGGGGSWGAKGFLMAATHDGALAYEGLFDGRPYGDGACPHLRPQCSAPKQLRDSVLYACTPMLVHEPVPATRAGRRQFVRLSLPNDCPWFVGYTPSPVGVRPTGPILPRRSQMDYRPR